MVFCCIGLTSPLKVAIFLGKTQKAEEALLGSKRFFQLRQLRQVVMRQVFGAVSHCHSKQIIHRATRRTEKPGPLLDGATFASWAWFCLRLPRLLFILGFTKKVFL